MQEITSIGISQKTGLVCEGEDLTLSKSGLYLDRLPGLGAEFFAPDGNYGACDEATSYLARMVSARQEGLELTREAILRALKAEYPLQAFPYSWDIGQKTGYGAANGTTLTLTTGTYTDAILHISRIGVVASGEGDAVITLSQPGASIQTFTIPVAQLGYNSIEADLQLPLDGTAYTFEVSTTGTVRLQSNSLGCGCGARDTALFKHIKFSQSTGNGISLAASIKCGVGTVLDRTYAADSDVQKVMARMLFYRSGVVLCDYVLGQTAPDSSDTNLEYVVAKRADLLKEFDERLRWLVESGIDSSSSACFQCSGGRIVRI